MLTCKQASWLLSLSLDRPLSWSERLQLRLHLMICDACQRFKQQLGLLRHAVQHLLHKTENDSSIQLNLAARNRIIASISDSESQ